MIRTVVRVLLGAKIVRAIALPARALVRAAVLGTAPVLARVLGLILAAVSIVYPPLGGETGMSGTNIL